MNNRLEDILADHLDVAFCGINPGKGSAAIGLHFANRSNRFWRTLHLAGFTPHEIRPEDGATLLNYRCGLTALVEAYRQLREAIAPAVPAHLLS